MIKDKLVEGSKSLAEPSTFGFNDEAGIISYALDYPDAFTPMTTFMDSALFNRMECQYVMAWILKMHKKFGVIPTRPCLRDKVISHLTVDHPYKDILEIVDKPSNPREVPIIKETLREWAQSKQFGLLYNEESIAAYHKGDFTKLKEIVDGASRISDVSFNCFWVMDQYQELLNPKNTVHYSTGFKKLDLALNDGGPGPGECLIWLAATNVGKSIWLCNNSVFSYFNDLNVLHITCEMSAARTARRMLGALTRRKMNRFYDEAEAVKSTMNKHRSTYKGNIVICEFNPEEASVNDIKALITNLRRTKGFNPNVVVIDYMELLMSRRDSYNDDEYGRQKHVATELCGLAKSEGVLVYSATQANRAGSQASKFGDGKMGSGVVDINQAAESYGKIMPVDYVVSLNQNDQERVATIPIVRMFIAKNREGPKSVTIECHVDYDQMRVWEHIMA